MLVFGDGVTVADAYVLWKVAAQKLLFRAPIAAIPCWVRRALIFEGGDPEGQ